MTFFTIPLTSGSYTINKADNVSYVSAYAKTGSSFTYLGSEPFQGIPPEPVTLDAGEGINVASASTFNPLDGITITRVSGTINITIGF